MHKTLYIDVDEEITSIVDRIRPEEALNIILVVPKNAMLTQGVINLKLLKKEINALGKILTIATNDKHARKVIERLEIKTQEAKGEVINNDQKHAADGEISKQATAETVGVLADQNMRNEAASVDSVGTTEFFDQAGTLVDKEGAEEEVASPENETADEPEEKFQEDGISSEQRGVESEGPEGQEQTSEPSTMMPNRVGPEGNVAESQSGDFIQSPHLGAPRPVDVMPPVAQQNKQAQENPEVPERSENEESKVFIKDENPIMKDLFGNSQEEEQKVQTRSGLFGSGSETSEKAEQFFSKEQSQDDEEDVDDEEKNEREGKGKKFWTILFILLILLGVISGAVAWVYANYPQVKISVFPLERSLSKEIKIVATTQLDSVMLEEEKIPGELVELTITKTMDFEATGEAYESDDGKARGQVTILNKYSASSQELVETTRLLSEEGKLFRILNDVEVPGMKDGEPGELVVAVIADEPGEEYNIDPTTFKILGFKGNPKYDKFEVSSSKKMSDGGEPDSNKKLEMVSDADLVGAREKTIESLQETLEQEIGSKLADGKKVLIDSVEKEIQSSSSSHKSGDITKNFSYQVDQKIKAITFLTEDVNSVVSKALEEDLEQGFSLDATSQITFKKGIADYEGNALTMYVEAQADSWPTVDTTEIVKGISGKNEEEMKSFLSSYPNIEKAEITMTPSWLATIPVSSEKISIEEMKENDK